MKDEFSKISEELLDASQKLKKITTRKTDTVEFELLKARSLDLIKEAISGEHFNERLKNLGPQISKDDLVKLIDIAVIATNKSRLEKIRYSNEEQSISEIVSSVFWRGNTVKLFLTIFGIAFSIVFALATFGTVTIFDETAAASKILIEAKSSLQKAKDELNKAESIKNQISDRIQKFNNQFEILDKSIVELEGELNSARELQANKIDRYEADMDREISQFRELRDQKSARLSTEFDTAFDKIKEKPGKLDELIKIQTDAISEKTNTFDTDYYNPLTQKYSFYLDRFTKLNKAIETLESGTNTNIDNLFSITKKLAASREAADDEIHSQEVTLQDLRKRTQELSENIQKAEIEHGSIDKRFESLDRLDYELIETKDSLIDLKNDAKVIKALAGDLNSKSKDVYKRINEAMKLSSEDIANSFQQVLYSDRWLKIVGIFLVFQFFIFFIWLWKHGSNIKKLKK